MSYSGELRERSSRVVAFCRGGPGKLELRKFFRERKASGSRTISWNLKKMVVDDSRRRKSGKRLNNDFNGTVVLPPLFSRPLRLALHFLILSCLSASPLFPRHRNLVGCKLISPISYATVHQRGDGRCRQFSFLKARRPSTPTRSTVSFIHRIKCSLYSMRNTR